MRHYSRKITVLWLSQPPRPPPPGGVSYHVNFSQLPSFLDFIIQPRLINIPTLRTIRYSSFLLVRERTCDSISSPSDSFLPTCVFSLFFFFFFFFFFLHRHVNTIPILPPWAGDVPRSFVLFTYIYVYMSVSKPILSALSPPKFQNQNQN